MAGEPQLTEIAVIQADGKGNRGRPLLSEITAVQRAVRSAWPPYLSEITIVQNMGALPPPPPPARPPTTRGPAAPGRLGDIDCISNRMDVKRGNAVDAWTTLPLPENNYRTLEVRAWDKSLDIRWAPWTAPTAWTSPDEIPADIFKGFDGRVAAVQVRNHVLGNVSRYQVIGFRKRGGWADEMFASYLGRNPHATPSVNAQVELLLRLQPGGYLHTTFGPSGQNKIVCDFLKLFEFNGDLTTRTVTKAGAVLRWDVDGTVYAQNDWPIHVIDPAKPNVVTVSTTDGWDGVTEFYCNSNNLFGALPSFATCVNLVNFHCASNGFTGALPSFATCVNLVNFYCYANGFTGALPSFATCVNLVYFYCNSNGFTTYIQEAIQVFRLDHRVDVNSFDQASIDNFLLDYELIKTPMALSGDNYIINLSGVGNAPPSVIGIAARDAIIAEFAGTPGSGILTITHN